MDDGCKTTLAHECISILHSYFSFPPNSSVRTKESPPPPMWRGGYNTSELNSLPLRLWCHGSKSPRSNSGREILNSKLQSVGGFRVGGLSSASFRLPPLLPLLFLLLLTVLPLALFPPLPNNRTLICFRHLPSSESLQHFLTRGN